MSDVQTGALMRRKSFTDEHESLCRHSNVPTDVTAEFDECESCLRALRAFVIVVLMQLKLKFRNDAKWTGVHVRPSELYFISLF